MKFATQSRLPFESSCGRETLNRLKQSIEIKQVDQPELSEVENQLSGRAAKIQKFFTQPFFVAEAHTDTPGEYVKAEETIKALREILEGKYDDLSDQSFYFVGGIDEVIAKSHTS